MKLTVQQQIFSCEEAALEVQMSVCLSVCVCVCVSPKQTSLLLNNERNLLCKVLTVQVYTKPAYCVKCTQNQ